MIIDSMALRLRSFYFFSCGVGGVTYFLSVWLKNRGLDAESIGLVMSMTAISKMVFGSVGASLSDKGFNAKNIITILSFIGLIGAIILLPETNTMFYMFAVLVATGGMSSSTPIGEAITVNAIKTGIVKQDYAKIRVVGTLSYVFIAVFSGYMIKRFTAFPDILIYELIFCAFAMIIVSRFIKDPRDLKAIKDSRAKFSTLFKQKDFMLVITIQSLFYMSFGMQNSLGPAYWEASGINPFIIGLLSIPAIFSETVFFLSAKRFFNIVPYQTLFLVSSFTTMIRWIILAFTNNPIIIGCAFLLHGINFCCTHLGMMAYIRDVIPDNLSTRAQAAYAIGAGGIFSGVSMIAYGYIYPYLGGKAFLVSAGLSFVATIFALRLKGVKIRIKRRLKSA